MGDSGPNTGYEQKLDNCSSYMDPEHTLINIPDNFLWPDDATMIPTSPEGLPNFEASSSSKLHHCSDPLVSGNRVHVVCRVVLASRKVGQSWTHNLSRQRFPVQSKGKRDRDTNVVHSLRDREHPQKILERRVDLVVRGEIMAQRGL